MELKLVQILSHDGFLLGLDAEGSVWKLMAGEWHRFSMRISVD